MALYSTFFNPTLAGSHQRERLDAFSLCSSRLTLRALACLPFAFNSFSARALRVRNIMTHSRTYCILLFILHVNSLTSRIKGNKHAFSFKLATLFGSMNGRSCPAERRQRTAHVAIAFRTAKAFRVTGRAMGEDAAPTGHMIHELYCSNSHRLSYECDTQEAQQRAPHARNECWTGRAKEL